MFEDIPITILLKPRLPKTKIKKKLTLKILVSLARVALCMRFENKTLKAFENLKMYPPTIGCQNKKSSINSNRWGVGDTTPYAL